MYRASYISKKNEKNNFGDSYCKNNLSKHDSMTIKIFAYKSPAKKRGIYKSNKKNIDKIKSL